MTETTTADATSRELHLDPEARVEIVVTSSNVRLRGTDDGRLIVRSRDGEHLGDHVRIDTTTPGVVRIRDADSNYRVGPVFINTRRTPDLDIDLPRETPITLRTMSGDIEATGIAADSRWASA